MKEFNELFDANEILFGEPQKAEVNEAIGGFVDNLKSKVAGVVGTVKGALGVGGAANATQGRITAVQNQATPQLQTAITKFTQNLFKQMKVDGQGLKFINFDRQKTKDTQFTNSNEMVVEFVLENVYLALKKLAPKETKKVVQRFYNTTVKMDKDPDITKTGKPDIVGASASQETQQPAAQQQEAPTATPAQQPAPAERPASKQPA